MKILRVIDLETCGLKPPAGICEVATVDVVISDDGIVSRGETWATLINPGEPIPPEASAIHGIVDDMVMDAPPFDLEIVKQIIRGDPAYLVAHNSKFDRQWFDPPSVRWLDTYKIALWLWPSCPSHSNQCLRYWLKLKFADDVGPVHRATADTVVTAAVLRRAFTAGATIEQMVEVSSQPALLPRFRFGKNKNVPIEKIDAGYLDWILSQKNMDEDARHTAFAEIQRRRNLSNLANKKMSEI